MAKMFTLIAVSLALELLLYGGPLWRFRRSLAIITILLIAYPSGWLLAAHQSVTTVLIVLTNIFRIINLLRVIEGRSHEKYLKSAAWRATYSFLAVLVGLAAVYFLRQRGDLPLPKHGLLEFLAVLQLLVAITVLAATLRNIRKMAVPAALGHIADNQLPTVTVAVPARNETASLEACLASIVSNDYPKLEILALDDCSQDKTNEVIKSFAQAGVRFIKGQEPKENWLAKNQAYDQLQHEATGQYILFCGVDTRLSEKTIRSMLLLALAKNKDMVSVLPKHADTGWIGALIQPMRYWWEVAMPRRYFNRPAVLSTCWLIKKSTIQKLGGFEAVSRAVLPEAYFARQLVASDAYAFVRTGGGLQVSSEKNFQDQFDRAIRVRYPEVHRRLELVLLLALVEALLLFGPFVLVVAGLALRLPWVAGSAAIASGLLITAHCTIVQVSSRLRLGLAVVNFPLVVLVELALGIMSMFKYEFSVVDWKGRNICLPVMHAAPRRFSSSLRGSVD